MNRSMLLGACMSATLCLSMGHVLLAEPAETRAGAQEEVGWLKPNTNHPELDARYALVDRFGVVRYYVRPAAGVRLARHLDHKVRLRGTELSAPDARHRVLEVDALGSPDEPIGDAAAPPRLLALPTDEPIKPISMAELRPRSESGVELAAAQIPLPEGEYIDPPRQDGRGYRGPSAPRRAMPMPEPQPDAMFSGGGEMVDDGGGEWFQPEQYGPECGGCQNACCPQCRRPFCGPPGRLWVRAEYLYWFSQGMHIPPLVTTGPNAANPGILGLAGTQILYGGNQVDGNGRSGGRITIGTWLNPCQTVGFEGDYFGLATANSGFFGSSTGTPILARPFFDLRPDLVAQNVELVAAPGVISGSVDASTFTRVYGAGLRGRFNLACAQDCYNGSCLPGLNGPGGFRLDFLLGWRYLRLRDGVQITENLTSLNANLPGTFVVNDRFASTNTFNGVDIGTVMEAYRGRWTLDFLSKFAIGSTHEIVDISGSTVTTQNGVVTNSPGGLLAQSTNIGRHTQDGLAVVPELGTTLGYYLTPRLRATLGYSFIYWSRVARAGEQIDTDVNSRLLPGNPAPLAGDLRHPQFVFHDNSFWMQGISGGLDFRF